MILETRYLCNYMEGNDFELTLEYFQLAGN